MKLRFLFLLTAFIAVLSAFSSRPTDTIVFRKASTNNYSQLDNALKNAPHGWRCDGVSNTCTYKLKAIHGPAPYQDSDMEPAEAGTFTPIP